MKRSILSSILVSILLSGCARDESLDPPQIRFGQDVCAECGMIVSDERFAGAIQLIDVHGERQTLLFDDIGEMLKYQPPSHQRMKAWVRDADTKAWLDAQTAWFNVKSEQQTPMATGVSAHASESAAAASARAHGGTIVEGDTVARRSR